MAEKIQRKNLGRGLSALIPDVDMEFLSQIVRDKPLVDLSTGRSKRKALQNKAQSTQSSAQLSPEPQISFKEQAKPSKNDSNKEDILTSKQRNQTNTSEHLRAEEDLSVKISFVSVDDIEANPFQPRRFFSPQELEDLVSSLREHGVLQPIILRPRQNEMPGHGKNYQLVAGERRWRAAQTAGLTEIPAIIRPVTDQQALELALIENVQRHDISALDAAIAYRRLSQEFSLSQEQVALRVGKSRSSIANTIRLLDLPIEAQKAIEEGTLSEGHGRAILLASSDGARRAVLRRVLRDKLSVRNTEELARQTIDTSTDQAEEDQRVGNSSSKDDVPLKQARLSIETRRIEESLQKHLGTRVKLKLRRQGGQVMIHYFSNEELERLLKLIVR